MPEFTGKLTLAFADESYDVDARELLGVNRDDLDLELSKQAATFAWYAVLEERARAWRKGCESEFDRAVAEADRRERAKEKATETAIKHRIVLDEKVRAAEEEVRNAVYAERTLGALASALGQRKDMLIALARARQTELSALSAAEVERIKERILGRKT